MLYSSEGLCPRFYGLPKIHKPGIPLRPIVRHILCPNGKWLYKNFSP